MRMEISKGDERSAEHAAALFGSARLDNQMTHSEQDRKRRSSYCKIIIGVSLRLTPIPITGCLYLMPWE